MFYAQFIKLCKERNDRPSLVAEAIGLNKSSATAWKNGSTPSDVTMLKLAEYFGVDVSYFDGQEEEEQKDILQDLCDTDRALLHSIVELTDEQKKMMQIFIRGLKGEENG